MCLYVLVFGYYFISCFLHYFKGKSRMANNQECAVLICMSSVSWDLANTATPFIQVINEKVFNFLNRIAGHRLVSCRQSFRMSPVCSLVTQTLHRLLLAEIVQGFKLLSTNNLSPLFLALLFFYHQLLIILGFSFDSSRDLCFAVRLFLPASNGYLPSIVVWLRLCSTYPCQYLSYVLMVIACWFAHGNDYFIK